MLRVICYLSICLQLLIWIAARRNASIFSHDGIHHHLQSGERAEPPEVISGKDHSDAALVVSEIGSSPPSCAHKCYGCSPCEAVQVPATSDSGGGEGRRGVRVQYTNYEPEGWKCKCGPSLYSP